MYYGETTCDPKENNVFRTQTRISELNRNFTENPIYVYFEHNNKKISELIIPDSKLNLEELITEKAKLYNIEKSQFIELVKKNKIDLLDNNDNRNNLTYGNYENKEKNDYLNDKENQNMKLTKSANLKSNLLDINNNANNNEFINKAFKNKYKNIIQETICNKADKTINNSIDCPNTKNVEFSIKHQNTNINENYNLNCNSFVKNSSSNREVLKNSKLINNLYFTNRSNIEENSNYESYNNSNNFKPDNNKDYINKNSKKMNIIKNLKKAGKKKFKKESDRPTEINNIDNYILHNHQNLIFENCIFKNYKKDYDHTDKIYNNKNVELNKVEDKCKLINSYKENLQIISPENELFHKRQTSTTKSSKSIIIAKKNLNKKLSNENIHHLIDESKDNKINKILNKQSDQHNKTSKYDNQRINETNKIEFLNEREKESFSILYSLRNNQEKLTSETNRGKNFYCDNNNCSSSATTCNNHLISSNKISSTNFISQKNFNYNHCFKDKSEIQNSNEKLHNPKKLNFRKIKLNASLNQKNKPNGINSSTSTSMVNNFSNRLKQPFYELDSLYNTDSEYIKGKKIRNTFNNNYSSVRNYTNYSLTRKSLFSQRRETYFKQNNSIFSFKPKLNSKSIFMSIRSKYSKILQKEQENNSKCCSINSNIEKTNNFDVQNRSNSIIYNYTDDGFNNTQKFYEKKFKNKNRSNRFNIDYISRTDVSVGSKSKSRLRSVDEINNITNRLYNYASRYRFNRQKRENEYFNNTCPFTPYLINDVYKINNIQPNIRNFFFRLQNWVDRRNLKYETDYENTYYDNKTGDRLFSPRINICSGYNKRKNVIIFFLSMF